MDVHFVRRSSLGLGPVEFDVRIVFNKLEPDLVGLELVRLRATVEGDRLVIKVPVEGIELRATTGDDQVTKEGLKKVEDRLSALYKRR